jgi:hypothetical protein
VRHDDELAETRRWNSELGVRMQDVASDVVDAVVGCLNARIEAMPDLSAFARAAQEPVIQVLVKIIELLRSIIELLSTYGELVVLSPRPSGPKSFSATAPDSCLIMGLATQRRMRNHHYRLLTVSTRIRTCVPGPTKARLATSFILASPLGVAGPLIRLCLCESRIFTLFRRGSETTDSMVALRYQRPNNRVLIPGNRL